MHYSDAVNKTSALPQVRVTPELRQQAEQALRPGETLSEFVEEAVSRSIRYRRIREEADARARAAPEHHEATGISYSSDEVLAQLRAMTAARRRELQAKRSTSS